MKRNYLAASIAALAASNAFAVTDYNFVIAGASAPTNALGTVVARDICTANTRVVVGGGGWAVECDVNGSTVGFFKNDDGSAAGVAGLDDAAAPSQLSDMDTLVNTDGCTAYSTYADALANACGTASTTNRTTDVGVSDVDPRTFVGALADLRNPATLPVGGVEQAANINEFQNNSNLQVSNLGSLMFGIVVTEPFYAALQNSQFRGGACDPQVYAPTSDGTDFDSYPESASLDCMPSLARAEVAAILSGQLATASELGSSSYTYNGQDLSSVYGNAYYYWFNGQANGGAIDMCLRNQGSGTHAVTMSFFLRTNCGALDSRPLVARECDRDASGSDCGGVVGNEGSSDLTRCMTAKAQAGKYALGYHSLEKNANLQDGDYRFVKIDGVAPNLENFIKGEYKEYGNVTMQLRGVSTWSAANGFDNATETAAASAIFNQIIATFASDASALGDLNTAGIFQHPFGEAGWATQAATAGSMIGADVNKDVAGHIAKPVNSLVYVQNAAGIQGLCGTPSTAFGAVDAVR